MYYLPIATSRSSDSQSTRDDSYTLIVPLARALEYHAVQDSGSSDTRQLIFSLPVVAVLPLAIFGGGVAAKGPKC